MSQPPSKFVVVLSECEGVRAEPREKISVWTNVWPMKLDSVIDSHTSCIFCLQISCNVILGMQNLQNIDIDVLSFQVRICKVA